MESHWWLAWPDPCLSLAHSTASKVLIVLHVSVRVLEPSPFTVQPSASRPVVLMALMANSITGAITVMSLILEGEET